MANRSLAPGKGYGKGRLAMTEFKRTASPGAAPGAQRAEAGALFNMQGRGQVETQRFLNRGGHPFPGSTFPYRLSQSAGHKKMVVASLFLDDSGVYYGNGTKKIRKHQCHTEAPNQPLSDFPPRSCPGGSHGTP